MAIKFVLRQAQDEDNPRLPDAYGRQITVGRLVCWEFDGVRTRFIVFLCRGGEFGCEGLEAMYYNGLEVPRFAGPGETNPNWIFHPGTLTKQIEPKSFTIKEDRLVCAGHGYHNGDTVRVRATDGKLPTGLSETVKYTVQEFDEISFKLLAGGAPVDIDDEGEGAFIVWRANAGIDDPLQGTPTILPSINYTFSGICYVEGYVPAQFSAGDREPDGFKFLLKCRKVADYDSSGAQLPTPAFSANNAQVAADILLQELKMPTSRIDWASWTAFKNDCEKMVWHRVDEASSYTTGPGLTGRYYNRTDGSNPPQFLPAGAELKKTRGGEDINFNFGTSAPDTGLNNTWYLARWDGKLRPAYTENYTFHVSADDGFRLWIGDFLESDPPHLTVWANGVHDDVTIQKELVKNELVKIRMEYFNGVGPGSVSLKWSSPSTTLNPVPKSRLYPTDHQVKRYEAHLAIPAAMTAWQAFEEVMERAPGWHWQDVNGKIKFLPPDRPVQHTFNYDPDAAHTAFNVASKTFEAAPRLPEERINYQRYEFRDVEATGFAQSYLEAHRTDLREVQGGLPSDTSLLRMGVMTRSLAERIAETRMRLLSDPERQFTLRGQLNSYKISKGDRVKLSHFLSGDKHAAPVECIVTSETTGGNADEKTYTLMPVTFPFYEDEEV